MADDPTRMLTVTLPSDIWNHIIDRLGDYADEVQERPWMGDCYSCDKAAPGMCPDHREAAEYGGQVSAWRDQIVGQFADQATTTADLVRRSRLPLETEIGNVMPSSHGAVRNLLGRSGIVTLADLAAHSDDDLLGLRQFGPRMLAKLRAALHAVADS